MAGHAAYETAEFRKSYGRLDGSVRAHIDRSLPRLLDDPFHNTKTLNFPFTGKRSFRIGKCRIIFAVCGECRSHHWQEHNQCSECLSRPDRSIVLFTLGLRKNVYDG